MLVCGERQQDEANTATNTATNTDPIPNQAHPQMWLEINHKNLNVSYPNIQNRDNNNNDSRMLWFKRNKNT